MLSRHHVFIVRLIIAMTALLSAQAFAHQATASESISLSGFLTGLAHPVSGLDHILAMIAVGLWGVVLGMPAIWILPVTFPIVMAIGGFIGLLGVPMPSAEIGIALSAIVLGLMVAGEIRPPVIISAVIVGFFAIFHGYAHGRELPPDTSALLYSLGFVVSTGLLHAVGILLGMLHQWPQGRILLRIAGGLITLSGGYFLVQGIA